VNFIKLLTKNSVDFFSLGLLKAQSIIALPVVWNFNVEFLETATHFFSNLFLRLLNADPPV